MGMMEVCSSSTRSPTEKTLHVKAMHDVRFVFSKSQVTGDKHSSFTVKEIMES